MNPSEFLEVAERLKSSRNEGDRRTAVSRSYYGFFNLCVSRLSSTGVTFRNRTRGEIHGELLEYFNQCAKKFAAVLRDLRLARNAADYEMTTVVDERQSELYYRKARDAFNDFTGLSQNQLEAIARCIASVVYPPRRRY